MKLKNLEEFDMYGVLAAGTPIKANIDGEWLVGKKLETTKNLEMLDSFSDNKTILVEIDGKEKVVNNHLVKVFEPMMVDDNGNKPKLEEFKKEEFQTLLDCLFPKYSKYKLDNDVVLKINIDHNKAEISHDKSRVYPIIQESEYRHAFVEYPCWAVEQAIMGRKIIVATPTGTMVAAKLFLEIITEMNK